MQIDNTKDLKAALRNGPYAFPGGYPVYFIAADGEPLSYDAVKNNLKLVMHAVAYPHYREDGWRIVGMDINWEDPELFCAHTGDRIESAYAEND